MNRCRRLTAFLTACLLLAGMGAVLLATQERETLSLTASAEEEISYTEGTYGNLTYLNYGEYIEISGCDKSAETVEIPAEIDGLPVTCIGEWAFKECTNLKNISIPDSVTRIGEYAFSKCTGLRSVKIPDGVTSLETNVFYECTRMTSISIPDSVTSIGIDTLWGCGLTSVTIPGSVERLEMFALAKCENLETVVLCEGVEEIGSGVLSNCYSLKTVTIPASVTSIGEVAFYNCTSLTDVCYPGTEEQWNALLADSGNTSLKDAAIHFNSAAPQENNFTVSVAVALQKYLLNIPGANLDSSANYDLNADGALDAFDLALLKRKLLQAE